MILLRRPPSTTPLTAVLLLAVALVAMPPPQASATSGTTAALAHPGVDPLIDESTGTAARVPVVTVADLPASTPFIAEWSWPLDPAPSVLRHFQKPPKPWQRGHRGVDLAVVPRRADAVGASIQSPADGVVSFAGTVVDRGVLSIDHGGGRISSFEPVSTELSKGQPVREGDVVAALAPTRAASGPWHCASPCLHWGVRVDGDYVDPLSFVMDRRPSVLLPLDDE